MTNTQNKKEVQGINASQKDLLKGLELELGSLIEDETNGLSDLTSFAKNLSHEKSDKKLTKHNLRLIKEDLQDGGLIDMQGGDRNGKAFGFEVIGNDIQPTLTPNGDCLIPVNFRYDSQKRTKLLILHIEDVDGKNVYSIPNGANEYPIEIGRESWLYTLRHDKNGFHLMMK